MVPPEGNRLGNGVVQRGLIKALAVSGRPMGVCEAQAAVEALLGHCVSRGAQMLARTTGSVRLGSSPSSQATIFNATVAPPTTTPRTLT
jgi:hypothetical protein